VTEFADYKTTTDAKQAETAVKLVAKEALIVAQGADIELLKVRTLFPHVGCLAHLTQNTTLAQGRLIEQLIMVRVEARNIP
jgi:hypothetical protein